jgi:hypothetical protein
MAFLVLILLAGIFSLVHIFKAKDKFAKVINGTFVAAIGVSFIPIPQIAIDGYYLFAIGCVLVILYAFSDGSFTIQKKGLLIGSGLAQLTGIVFFLGKYPYTNIAYLLGLVTIVSFSVFVLKNIRNYANEIGFLAVLMADALIKVSMILLA